jgi:hypothetical protein
VTVDGEEVITMSPNDTRKDARRAAAAITVAAPDGPADGGAGVAVSQRVDDQAPLPPGAAWGAVARCVLTAAGLLLRHRVSRPREWLGVRVRFADGTSSTVYRETALEPPRPEQPCVLVVKFRLRLVRGFGHRLFRWMSMANTPLFIGFPGFVAKLWMAHDQQGVYRGVYQWDGPDAAQAYARSLWRVLALVSEPGSIDYRVLPGQWRDELLVRAAGPDLQQEAQPGDWWRPVGVDREPTGAPGSEER